MDSTDSNQLHNANSPYLRQHADNPVHWQQWTPEVLALARALNKPVLLSIGYSACHWCHVMAHESFEDPATAEVMNRHFINIKLDREERPDLDRIYQLAHQLMNQQGGGWPLTVFLDPRDQTPFFSGTYFPPQPRHGLPGFVQLLEGVQRFYQENSDSLPAQAQRIQAALQYLGNPSPEPAAQDYDAREILRDGIARHFDEQWGGFLGAPKFPQAAIWSALLAVSRGAQEDRLVRGTLDGMSRSGLFDHVAGGFFRYSVDDHWEIPHFEKMLYDNGQLLKLYADAAARYSNGTYAAVVSATADWLLAEMLSESGAFYSALDADSEGEEGKYYVWTKAEATTLLTRQEWGLAKAAYGFSESPNFEGRWHLTRYPELEELPSPAGADHHRKQVILETVRQKLAASRQQRIKPFRDEKILTAWNGLAATGLIEAARVLNREDYLQAADRCLEFIKANQWDGEKLRSCYKDGQSYETGHLDDYAFVAEALLHRLQSEWDDELYSWLLAIKSRLMEDFADPGQGGFYFTALEREDLLIRHRVLADEAIPSGNAVALKVLLALAHLDADWALLEFVEKSVTAWPDTMKRQPQSHATLLALKTWLDEGVELVVIRGKAEPAQIWSREAGRGYHPARFIFAIPAESAWKQQGRIAPAEHEVCAYYCQARQCLPVFTTQRDLVSALDEGSLG